MPKMFGSELQSPIKSNRRAMNSNKWQMNMELSLCECRECKLQDNSRRIVEGSWRCQSSLWICVVSICIVAKRSVHWPQLENWYTLLIEGLRGMGLYFFSLPESLPATWVVDLFIELASGGWLKLTRNLPYTQSQSFFIIVTIRFETRDKAKGVISSDLLWKILQTSSGKFFLYSPESVLRQD